MATVETHWQIEACDYAVLLGCRTDGMGYTRVVEAPVLLHFMKGWLIDDVVRHVRRCGWRFRLVA